MSTPRLPSVELIQGGPAPETRDAAGGRRWKVFFSVFLITLTIAVAIVYGRSPIYRATASVLTVKPKAIDTPSAAADVEHVVIQGRLLLGDRLLGRLADQLAAAGEDDLGSPDRLRGILAAVPVPDTNLLELRAEGDDPQQLQRVVNRWAESYEEFRAEEIEAATGRTTAEIEDQQAQLQSRIDTARIELQAFRETHDIVSLERRENRSLAALGGLNDSLNKARERLVEARARKSAVEGAIERGETVIPSEQKADIARLRLAIQRGQSRLADLRQKYTQRYLDSDPATKTLPDELREMERELALALDLARRSVRDEAAQAVEAAAVSVQQLEQQLSEQQSAVQDFTDRFKEFKSLEAGLARLDELYAENQQRLAQIQVRNLKKFPPIQIVEWARVPSRPIYPQYERDLLIGVGVALALALFVTWLVEYLGGRSSTPPSPYVGVRVYSGEQEQALESASPGQRLAHHGGTAPREADATARLPGLPRELTAVEVRGLLDVIDETANAYCALLLSGISPYELPLLHRGCFDESNRRILVPGESERVLPVGEGVWRQIQPLLGDPDGSLTALALADLNSRLHQAAANRRIREPGSVTALALWHSYVLFLARQGIDASALEQRVGSLPAEVQDNLSQYAPPGGARPTHSIDFDYPALVV